MNQIIVICLSLANFFILMTIQIIVCRYKKWNKDKTLLSVWLILPIPLVFLEIYMGFLGLNHKQAALILTYLLSGAWIVSFPAIYAASPTLVILLQIEKGINSFDELKEKSNVKINSHERVEDATNFGLVKYSNNKTMKLTLFGKIFYKLIVIIKTIHGIKKVESV